jgi:hypothetical protein
MEMYLPHEAAAVVIIQASLLQLLRLLKSCRQPDVNTVPRIVLIDVSIVSHYDGVRLALVCQDAITEF